MNTVEDNFIVQVEPRQYPYILFVDDTLSHFCASQIVYGLLVKPHLNSSLLLTKKARKIWLDNAEYFTTYNNSLGITKEGFDTLRWFVDKNYYNIHSIIIDWDKTMTVHSTFKCDNMNKYVAECYFGGVTRMYAIKYFLKTCKNKNIKVSILTSNGRARTQEGKTMFKQALHFVGGTDIDVFYTDKKKIAHINTIYHNSL